MKRILSSYYTKLFVFCQVLVLFMTLFTPVLSSNASASSTNNFYFTDAVFDYYLDRAEDGTSKMHVEETLTAVFPDTNQNHGITRSIPYTNQGGTNVTAESKNALNFKVKRNGKNENVAKTSTENGAYIFYVGDKNTYVHGEQVYNLSYDFTNVITRFSEMTTEQVQCIQAPCPAQSTLHEYQEIYWDTNGTGWNQTFENLTANLHLPDDVMDKVLTSQTSCYVGRYGSNNQSRCRFYKSDSNTITFTTTNLKAGENLTFAVDFEAGTFIVPAPPLNWTYVIATIIVALICGIVLLIVFRQYFKKAYPKKTYYRGLFVAPQYAPPKNYHVAEAKELYIGKSEKSYVATLLELAVSGKISFIKSEPSKILNKETWKIKINSLSDITDSQEVLLRIINGGSKPEVGEIIKIEKHTATAYLASLSRSYSNNAISKLKKLGFFEKSASSSSLISNTFFLIVFVGVFLSNGLAIGLSFLLILAESSSGVIVGESILPFICSIIIISTVLIAIIVSIISSKYKKYTTAGLDAANYLNGLHLYIKMAEADRIKFLQSVKGADTSKEGIVKLYEKLLPYASLFGLEESWMNSLGKYCHEIDYSPEWYDGDFSDLATIYTINSIASSINSSVSASTSYSDSSSGSSSSSSGGGGGGFSGGGGGGGGGGGW